MSDFDKEAEREKLRKKYADDEDKRANTKRMSELLLKGATMTNQHCDTCGDPLFRHNGQTFCPTCQAGAQQAADDGATQQPVADGDTQPSADDAQPTADKNAPSTAQQPTSQPSVDGNAGSTTQQSPASQPSAQQPPTEQSTNQPSTPQPSATDRQPEPPATNGRASDAASSAAAGSATQGSPVDNEAAPPADLTTARQSLVGTVTRFSQQAAKADDPRRAKELLTAAREAAETLRALEFE